MIMEKMTFDEFLILDHELTPSQHQDEEVRKKYVGLYQEYLDSDRWHETEESFLFERSRGRFGLL